MTKPNDTAHGLFHGLTKREYFAAMVLQGLAASHSPSAAVEKAVIYADDLIDELNRTEVNYKAAALTTSNLNNKKSPYDGIF